MCGRRYLQGILQSNGYSSYDLPERGLQSALIYGLILERELYHNCDYVDFELAVCLLYVFVHYPRNVLSLTINFELCTVVCLCAWSHLTSRMSNRAIDERTHSGAYERENIVGIFLKRSAFSARRTTQHQRLRSDCQQHNHQPCPE